jgi:hypothetical protein
LGRQFGSNAMVTDRRASCTSKPARQAQFRDAVRSVN